MRILTLTALLFAGVSAHALEIACWNTYAKKGSRPYIAATVVENNGLAKVRLNKQSPEWGADSNLEIPNEPVLEAEPITSNRSPYKGNNEYALVNARLILPADLSPAALKAKIATGIGMGPQENGVIIGDMAGGDGSGSHYSIRLRCTSR